MSVNSDTTEAYMSIPVSEFEALHDRIKNLKLNLQALAEIHHRTITPSRLHDPEHNQGFRNCPALSCKKAAEVLGR